MNRIQPSIADNKQLILPILIGVVSYLLITGYMGLVLDHEFLQSDVAGYWQDSLNWTQPFHPYHVPGYPLIIAALRGLTGAQIPPIPLMMTINFVAFIISLILVYAILRQATVSPTLSGLGTALFGLWPFVGVVAAVNPRADFPAIVFYLAGFYLLQRSRLLGTAAFWGLALLMHKAMWVFVALTVIAVLIIHRRRPVKELFAFGIILLLPLGILWFFGMLHHDSAIWIIAENLQNEIATRSSWPILDGLIGTLWQGLIVGDFKDILKGSALTVLAIFALVVLLAVGKYASMPYRAYGLAICAAVFILFIVLNQFEIWAALRFSRFLVLPLMWLVAMKEEAFQSKRPLTIFVITLAFFILFLTQVGFSWYSARLYFLIR